MQHKHIILALLLGGLLAACNKTTPIDSDDPTPVASWKLLVTNNFNLLEARYVVWLSDADGRVVASRELPGTDTAIVAIPGAADDARFDCTVARVTSFETGGSGGVRDTIIELTTYTNLGKGENLVLQNPEFRRITEVSFSLASVNSFDSIMVSSAIPFVIPQPGNNFSGTYRILHSGSFWIRLKVNGEAKWRFLSFENISANAIDLGELNVANLPVLFAAPVRVNLPVTTQWTWNVEGIVDTNRASQEYFPLGDLLRAPGGFVPTINYLDIYEPVTNDVFFPPPPKPYAGYRVQGYGADPASGNFNYEIDHFFEQLPSILPTANWDIEPTTVSNARVISVKTAGTFDVLAFSRSRTGSNPKITWTVHTKPVSGVNTYRLPDVPTALGNDFVPLKLYDFSSEVKARAESFDLYNDFQTIQRVRMRNNDLLWKAKAGYVVREEVF